MSLPPLPYHRYSTFVSFTASGSGLLLGANQFQPAVFVLEGLDLVNNPLNEGSSAFVTVQNPGPSAGQGAFFQAFVYATSQGSFSWRGEMVVFPSQTVDAIVEAGAWSVFMWGHVEPAYSISP